MRLEFDSKTSVHDQLMRLADSKKPGRKHQHRKGVKAAQRAKNKQLTSKRVIDKKIRVYRLSVAAYWRGEISDFPNKPF